MKHIASFSGGRTSAYMCKLLIEKFGRENVDFIYMDTGAEHPKTYEFIRKVNKEFNLNLVCLRVKINPILGDGNSYDVVSIDDICHDLKPFKDMMQKYGKPKVMMPHCTARMKEEVYKHYCDDVYGKGKYYTWLGMRVDEPRRLKYLDVNKNIDMLDDSKQKRNAQNIRYLAEISDFEKQDVLDFWKSMSFDLDLKGEYLGNCVFCVKKSPGKVALAARHEPELAQMFIEAIESPSVRIKEREKTHAKYSMYRKDLSLTSIIKMYEDFSEDDIMQTIRSMKREETGSCSESCEANFEFDFDEVVGIE